MSALAHTAAFVGSFVASFYALWVLYLAVMNLKRVRDAGNLPKTALVLGLPVLVFGLLIDLICNVLLSVVLLELPREMTVTARLKRHNRATGGWRKKVVGWFKPLLDPFDPSGGHI